MSGCKEEAEIFNITQSSNILMEAIYSIYVLISNLNLIQTEFYKNVIPLLTLHPLVDTLTATSRTGV